MSNLSDFVGSIGGGLTTLRRQLITTDGDFTKSANQVGDYVWVTAIAGGGGGGRGTNRFGANGGQYLIRFPVDLAGVTTVSCVIGDGGPQNSAGGITSFGAFISLTGGGPSQPNSAPEVGGAYGGGINGSPGQSVSGPFGGSGGAGASGHAGGGGGLVLDDSGTRGAGSGSSLSRGGVGYGAGANGISSGSDSNTGAGAPGAILVEWIEAV